MAAKTSRRNKISLLSANRSLQSKKATYRWTWKLGISKEAHATRQHVEAGLILARVVMERSSLDEWHLRRYLELACFWRSLQVCKCSKCLSICLFNLSKNVIALKHVPRQTDRILPLFTQSDGQSRTHESKKQDTKLLLLTSLNINQFSKFFR